MVSVQYDLRKPNRYPAEKTAGGTYGVIREFALCYRAAQTKPEKSRLLTGFTNLTGFNRKYGIGILTSEGKIKLLRLNGKLLKWDVLLLSKSFVSPHIPIKYIEFI